MSGHEGNGKEMARVRVATGLGVFEVIATSRGLRAVRPLAPAAEAPPPAPAEDGAGHAQAGAEFLRRYAAGEPASYEGPLDLPAPAFQLAVWERLRAIPHGTTTTYGALADDLGMPGEARAVGTAIAANPLCIVVPCHRVVAADGSLRGFAWGLDLKRRLLAHEGCGALPLFAAGGHG
jgi:methylated-DNA-[protein]-cysteine S-methyltransferase